MTPPGSSRPSRTEHLTLPGVLTSDQAAETVAGILAVQREDGAIPWFRGHHLDPWDHVEAAMALDTAGEYEAAERAYLWLARHQVEDGSWYAAYADGNPLQVTDRGRETNFVAYIAVGVWHHYLSTGDDRFLDRLWPAVYAAVEFVLRLQQPGGQIGWRCDDDGTHGRFPSENALQRLAAGADLRGCVGAQESHHDDGGDSSPGTKLLPVPACDDGRE